MLSKSLLPCVAESVFVTVLFPQCQKFHNTTCRAGNPSRGVQIATKPPGELTASVKAGKRCGSASEVGGARWRSGGKTGSPEPSVLMGGPGPSSFRSFIGRHVPGVGPVSSAPLNSVRQSMYIGTWNVLSLQSASSKLHELSVAIDNFRLGVLLVTETHWPGVETMSLDNGALFINSGRQDGLRREGVGIVLSRTVKNSLISYSPYSERIMVARLHTRHVNMSVVVAYAPTNDKDDSVKEHFYNQLSSILDRLPRQDVVVVGGDFNARVGGAHSLHHSSNDNGQRLEDLCGVHDLSIGGTMFAHKDHHKGTWRSPDGKTVTQIDHICVGRKWRSSLLDVRVLRSADIGSDHYLVRAKLRIRLSSARSSRQPDKEVPALERLRSGCPEVRLDYNAAIRNRFEALDPEESLEGKWEQLKEVIGESSLEVLGTRPRRARQQHLSLETRDLIAQRASLKRNAPEGGAEYSKLNKRVKQSARRDDQRWADRLAGDLEEAAVHGRQREIWQRIKQLSGNRRRRAAAVRDKGGNMIPDPVEQRARWAEHFSELLNPPPTDTQLSDLSGIPSNPCFPHLGEDDSPPSCEEVAGALRKLKNHKAPGVDGIFNEQLRYGAGGLVGPLVDLFSQVWREETVPEEWLKGVISVIPKKGDSSVCSNNRGITLRSTTSKLFQIVMLHRLSTGIELALREQQCGFRRNRSCIDQIYSLRTIIHQCIEFNLPLNINFIDFKSAFDCIRRDFIWAAFRHYGLPEKYIRVVRAFFDGTMSAVRHDGELSDWFSVVSGTGQGDIQGPPVFNIVINWAAQLAEGQKTVSRGFPLSPEGDFILDLDYADDMAVLDAAADGLQETTDLLARFAGYAGLRINSKKTKAMAVSRDLTQRPYSEAGTVDISVEGDPIEQVSDFTYLGSVISANGSIDRELNTRIGKAHSAFRTLNRIWHNRNIRVNTKVRIYRAAVLTVLLYGCEAWTTTQAQDRRLEAFHQRCLRKILHIRWDQHVTNAAVLERASSLPLSSFIGGSRLRWFGHVTRMSQDRIPKQLITWVPVHGKRSRGRPRKTWSSCVLDDFRNATGQSKSIRVLNNLASDRNEWRRMTALRVRIPEAGHSND